MKVNTPAMGPGSSLPTQAVERPNTKQRKPGNRRRREAC